ncbi:UDP-D-apiose/UDP-D-xylose synthase [Hordeum vulgare]|nr:UDP-D-apiose/UDP-D-xylose synthase [Hordeum vulgare]
MASGCRVDLDGGAVAPLTICMIGANGFIGSPPLREAHGRDPHVVLAVNVYSDKIRHLVDPPPPHLPDASPSTASTSRTTPARWPHQDGDLVLPLPPFPFLSWCLQWRIGPRPKWNDFLRIQFLDSVASRAFVAQK